MQTIKISDIRISPDRQRKEFLPEAIIELATSLRTKGMMHAPVLREEPSPTGPVFTLVAGERRIRAVQQLRLLGDVLMYNGEQVPDQHIPFVTLGQLSPLEAEEAELDENLHRKDLTWQENAAAMGKLHSLRSRQAQADGRIHTIADTALEVKGSSAGSSHDAVRKEVIIAQHLNNPAIAKATSTADAFKILQRQEVASRNVQLAKTVGATFTQAVHEVHNTDCLQWMSNCREGRFDVILTDPPYGMGADTFGDGGGNRLANNEHHYKDDYDSWLRLMTAWAPLAFRVAKPQAHAYVFCDLDNFHKLKDLMKAAGWYVFRTPFICTKPGSGRVPLPSEGPRRQWEMILYAIKGHKNTTGIYPDVITTTADSGLGHGAQKPVALYTDLLKRSFHPGAEVLDSFAGSGTIFPAAHGLQCKAVGLEMNPEYYGICLNRIKDLDKPVATDGASLGNELKQLLGKV